MVAAASWGVLTGAEEKPAAKGAVKESGFDKIKTLSGDWEVTQGPGEHGKHGGTVSYKVTAAGSAVLETLFGGSDHVKSEWVLHKQGKPDSTHAFELARKKKSAR